MPELLRANAMPAPTLEIRSLIYTHAGAARPALSLEEFSLEAGETCFVSGPSGCGKSTLLALCAGIYTPQQGTLRVLGHDVATMGIAARDRLRGVHLGVIFQQFNLLPYLSAMDNILLPLGWHAERRLAAGGTMRRARARAAGLLRALEVDPGAWERPARSLSVGQQQRVAAARALLGSPRLILADEPTSALDESSRDSFMRALLGALRHSSDAASFDAAASDAADAKDPPSPHDRATTLAPTLVMVSHDARLRHHFDRHLPLAPEAA